MHQLSMYLVATFLDKGGFQWFQKRTFWRKKGLFFSFEWKRQGCQSAYTFLHSQPDQLTKKATESGEIQNGNKMYHDICLITACSANSSSDWKKTSQKKRLTDKRITTKSRIFCKIEYFHLQTGLLHQDAHTHLKIVSKVAICLEKCLTWPASLAMTRGVIKLSQLPPLLYVKNSRI